jgi:5-methylcytosine-specific restriction endonuclease McrA
VSNPNRHVKAGGRAWEALRRRKWAETHTCYLCGLDVADWDDYALDHIQPDKLGGLPVYENTAVSHKACNLDKAGLTLDQYARKLSHDVEGCEAGNW